MANKMNLHESIRNDLNKLDEAPKYPLTGEEAFQSWLDASREEADKLSHEQGTFNVEVTIKTTVQVSAESAEYAEQEAEMMASNGELNIVGANSEVTAVVMNSLDEADTATFNDLSTQAGYKTGTSSHYPRTEEQEEKVKNLIQLIRDNGFKRETGNSEYEYSYNVNGVTVVVNYRMSDSGLSAWWVQK